MELREVLLNYRDVTASAIETIKEEKYEELDSKLNKREGIIESIKSLNFDSEHFKTLCDEFSLIQLECELNVLLKNRRDEIKIKLESLSKNVKANNSYNKIADSPFIFSKKI